MINQSNGNSLRWKISSSSSLTRSPGTKSVCFSVVTVNEEYRNPEFKIRVGVKFKKDFGLKATYGLQLYLKENSTYMFSCEHCEIF